MSDVQALHASCRTLVRHYPVKGWWPARSRFEVMVGAVLVQNTRWTNVEAAVRNLRRARCLTPAAISSSKSADLIELIRPAGCQSVKGQRLQALAAWTEASGGLRTLAARPTSALRQGLLGVKGVGPETADAILCFAFGRRVFIADRYARRWLERTGFLSIDELRSYEHCREAIEGRMNGSIADWSDLHAAIVQHAQSVCGREPKCADCIIRMPCRSG
jgi:endonuclease-3 related protein